MNTRSLHSLILVALAILAISRLAPAAEEHAAQEIWNPVANMRTLALQTHERIRSPISGAKASATALHIATLRLSIWPEYDDPRVLIMFRGEMTPGRAFPRRITLPVPQQAEIIGAGIISEQNELLLQPYQVAPGASSDSLELTLSSPRFFVELYYNPLGSGAEKHFSYVLSTPYALDQLAVDIQQPLRATHFTTDPPAMRQEQDAQGFVHYWLVYRDLPQHDTKRFTISYTKTAAGPSITKPQSAPPVAEQPQRAGNTTMLAVSILLGVAIALGGCAFLWMRYQRQTALNHQPPLSPTHMPATVPSTVTAEAADAAEPRPNFCSNCGAKLHVAYRYCPMCGRSLS